MQEVAFLIKLSDENKDGSPDETAKSTKSSHFDKGSSISACVKPVRNFVGFSACLQDNVRFVYFT